MRGKVLYVGRDPILPAFLSAYGTGSFSVFALAPEKYRGEAADLLLWDLDAAPLPNAIPAGTRVATVGYGSDADLARPFLFSEFEALLDPERGSPPSTVLSSAGRDLFSGNARVRLSPLEYDLFAALSAAEGAVPTELLCGVGGRRLSPHALGVALSSLRKKLDRLPAPPEIKAERREGYRLIRRG